MLAMAQRTANAQFKASRMMRANDDNTHKKPTEKTAVLGVIPVLHKPEDDRLKSGYRRPCPPLQEPLICHHGGHKGAHSERQPSCVSGSLIYDYPLCLAPLKPPQIQVWFSEIRQNIRKNACESAFGRTEETKAYPPSGVTALCKYGQRKENRSRAALPFSRRTIYPLTPPPSRGFRRRIPRKINLTNESRSPREKETGRKFREKEVLCDYSSVKLNKVKRL